MYYDMPLSECSATMSWLKKKCYVIPHDRQGKSDILIVQQTNENILQFCVYLVLQLFSD